MSGSGNKILIGSKPSGGGKVSNTIFRIFSQTGLACPILVAAIFIQVPGIQKLNTDWLVRKSPGFYRLY